ncbi:MAG: YitT family protein [Eubacteriales bacterium]|nr:YitT family protein [Eubacteriales bacterium]
MVNFRHKSAARDYVLIVIGSFIMGFAIKNIYDPIGMVTGGASGVAIIVKEKLGTELWVTNTLINIPLFLAAAKLKGWHFMQRTLAATAALSVSLGVIPEMPFLMDDLVLTALFGGMISGVGTGLVLSCQATTGGTDMLAALIQRRLPHYSIAQIMQVLDAAVVLAGATVFGITYAMYALIAIFVLTKVSDGLAEGMKISRIAFIITDRSDEISRVIMDEMERGATGIPARGMYSGEKKDILFCVVSKKEIVQLKELVVGHDPQAFVIVSDAREVLGEGFIEFRQ